MEVLFNKYHRILIDLLMLFLFVGLSIHPFFVKEVSYLLVFVKYIARLGLLFYSLKLGYSVFSTIRINIIAWAFLSLLLFIIIISIYSVLINDIDDFSSPLVVFIFCLIFLIFYTLFFDNRRLFVKSVLIVKKNRVFKRLLRIFAWFLLLSMCLEIAVKFVPSNILLYNNLRKEGAIAFAFRLCGFMLDANRWALSLLFILVIYRSITKKYFLKNRMLFYIVICYLLFTLSKTAFFIFIMIIMIYAWGFLSKIRLKNILLFILSLIAAGFLLSKTGYKYEQSGLQRRLSFTIESIISPSNSYTVNERKETFKDAIGSIIKHPLTGVGYLNFTAHTSASGTLTIHNTFLALLCYFGLILGPIIYIYMFILPFILLASKYGASKQLLELFIISFIFMNLLSVAHDMVLILIFYIALIVFEITSRIKLIST